MSLVYFVLLLSLLQFFLFGIQVGNARRRFGVPAPATSGHPDFERVFRVQMNTLEQLALFVPSLLLFAHLVDERWAAWLGIVYLIGRQLYSRGYAQAAAKRSLGFAVSSLPVMILLVGSLVAAGMAAWRDAGLG